MADTRSLTGDLRAVVTAVLLTPTRFYRLLRLGPRGLRSMFCFLAHVVPHASRVLATLRAKASRIPDPSLRMQALSAIDTKAYHVQGGCVLATFLEPATMRRYVELVAPLETLYDYLDNLCDRLPNVRPSAYRPLHEALLDAIDDRRPLRATYYRNGPHGDDGGYLTDLVVQVRTRLQSVPQYVLIRERLVELATLYAELQTFKHGDALRRETDCRAWYERNRECFPGLYWWEFAAACGSSLPTFALLFAAVKPDCAPHAAATLAAYFPHVSAVHILLDYYIDQAEDREHRELNFFACYATRAEALGRLRRFVSLAAEQTKSLPDGWQHRFALHAMCLFYLTHPKVFAQRLDRESSKLLAALDETPAVNAK